MTGFLEPALVRSQVGSGEGHKETWSEVSFVRQFGQKETQQKGGWAPCLAQIHQEQKRNHSWRCSQLRCGGSIKGGGLGGGGPMRRCLVRIDRSAIFHPVQGVMEGAEPDQGGKKTLF